MRPDDPQQLARFVWALVHGVAMLIIDGLLGGADADTFARFASRSVRTGVGRNSEFGSWNLACVTGCARKVQNSLIPNYQIHFLGVALYTASVTGSSHFTSPS